MLKNKNCRPGDSHDIDAFMKQVKLIRECSYFQNLKNQKLKINWNENDGLKVESTPVPDRESIESLLLRMRPIIVYKEPLYIGKIINNLIRQSKNEKEKMLLLRFTQALKFHRNKRLFSIKIDKTEYGMPDFVWLYLYGKYFHLDKNKRKVIKKFEDVFGSLTEMSALSQIEGYAGLAFLLASSIKKLERKK